MFGLRWLLRRLEICPNAYYNYRKHRKADYYANKAEVHAQIQEIYHIHNGVDGYRSMKVYLERRGYSYSTATVHKYMNTELGLHSIVRPKKPEYEHGKPHKIFDNKLNQDFTADEINRKWCTDFTYLFLSNHEVRYNCTILDLHDRSVVASITDRRITSNLAIRTLQKALESQPPIKGGLILHSDQGSQFTSKAFVEFCESVNVTQSMSKAGYPYDNAPMERYFNTLKNECTNLYEFETEKALYQKVEEFAYYIYGPTNLSVKIKNSEKSLTYLLKKKHKTKIFILELDNEQIWLHIPVVGGKVGSLIENLKEDFAQHEMEAC